MNHKDSLPILAPATAHLPLVILIDNSTSMNKERLARFNDSLNNFIETIAKDDYQAEIVDILRLNVYGSKTATAKFMPACLQMNEQIKIGNSICISYDSVNEMIRERIRLYNMCGTPCFKVQIFFFTSNKGYADVRDILKIKKFCEISKYTFNLIGTNECSQDTFSDVRTTKIVLENDNFGECFKWIKSEYFEELFCHFSFATNGGYTYIPDCFKTITNS